MKLISLSIRDFAIPVPRTGSIEAHSGYARAQEGQEIHQRVQARRAEVDEDYEAEVQIAHEFEREGFLFRISGRMDGIFHESPPIIEEIKTTFNIRELRAKLDRDRMLHPYYLQLQTYGYFYQLEHLVVPDLRFHLVSTRNGESEDFEVSLETTAYETWLNLRLDELVGEAHKAEKRVHRRKKIAEKFPFPFENPRRGQVELIQAIEEGFNDQVRMLVQAPTGLGKTAGVLYPSLKEALSRGQRVIYVTPKNSQHLVAEDAIRRFHETGSAVKSLTLTAKAKICFKNEPICNPEYCEFARDYYGKVDRNQLIDSLRSKKKLKARHFREMGEKYEVCPFELQLNIAEDVDTVICDYNYVFSPRSALAKTSGISLDQEGLPNLVIDEAHNLPSRAMDYYSPSLSTVVLEKMRDEIREIRGFYRQEAEEILDGCIQAVIYCRPDENSDSNKSQSRFGRSGNASKIDPPIDPFLEQDSKLRTFLSRYLDSVVEVEPGDLVLRLCFYWAQFTEALTYVSDPERTEFFTTFNTHHTGGVIKITCCDASKMLEACYDEFQNVVGFSATLKPFEYYAKLSGLNPEKLKLAEFQSPFTREQRKVLIIPQISTKYSDRERNYPKIADAIRRMVLVKPGNYFAFFPSFDFLERVLSIFKPIEDYQILRQEREMRSSDVEAVLDHLREGSVPTLIFAVQGGVFSEGVDYPGEMIIGAFVIGPPLPSFDLEREEMREYYEKNYGAGFDYAYTYPAMAKAIQAAGRVIRTETDRGLIVLMDNRFMHPSYYQSMPTDWFQKSPSELVSGSILKDLEDFWNLDQPLPSR